MLHKRCTLDTTVTAAAVALAGLLLLPNLGFGLWEPWEPKYAQSAVEMMERGDYLTPFFRGEPRFSKPILPYWLILASYAAFGVNEFATRLPFALYGVATVGVFVYALSRLFNRTLGFLAGTILLTSPIYYLEARQAVPDILFVGNLTMALCFLALALFEDRWQRWRLFLFYITASLAVLSKGPLALATIVAIVALYTLLSLEFAGSSLRRVVGDVRELLFSRMKLHWGAPLFMALTVPWYAYSVYHYDVFLDRLEFDYIERFMRPEGDHGGGLAYYVEPMIYGMFPWCALIPVALLVLRIRPKHTWRALEKKQLFFACWFVGPFLMFTAAATKFGYYILPAVPPLALVGGLYLSEYVTRHNRPATYFALFIIAFGIFLLPARELCDDPKELLGAVTIKNSVRPVIRADEQVPDPRRPHLLMSGLFGGLLLGSAVMAFRRPRVLAVVGLCGAASAFCAYNAQALIVDLSPHKGQKEAIDRIKKVMAPREKIAIYYPTKDTYQHREWSAIEASAIFYTNNQITELTTKKDVQNFFKGDDAAYCIVRRTYLDRFRNILNELGLPMHIIDSRNYRFRTISVKGSAPEPPLEQIEEDEDAAEPDEKASEPSIAPPDQGAAAGDDESPRQAAEKPGGSDLGKGLVNHCLLQRLG